MNDAESVLSEYLLEWEERRQRGESICVDALCVDRPDLSDDLARRIQLLESMYEALDKISSSRNNLAAANLPPNETPELAGYEVIRMLGSGGMGVVYEAHDQRLRRPVALKMLRSGGHATPTERVRFRIEAEAVAALQHPNIVQIYEVGDVKGHPFLALEFVGGSTLAERLRAGPLDAREAAEMVAILADAVDYAHRRGVIHRDLKPGNILLTANGVPKITDFGLAKWTPAWSDPSPTGHTQTGDVLGTPGYMAPEQIAGHATDIGPLVDVYSLGAILYESVTGHPPFQGVTPLDTLRQALDAPPPSPSQIRPGVPRDLATICMKCMEKEPARRYATAADLADDLRHYLAGEPIQARPAGWVELTAKWAKRRPAIASLAAAILGLLVILAVGGTTLAVMAIRARDDAVTAMQKESESRAAAQARERETAQVLSFVENKIFAAARPSGQMGGLGPDVTLRQAVENAIPYIETSLADEPLIEARLHLTLGISFYYLGDGQQSVEQCERARDIYLAHLGPNHPDTLRSMSKLAISYDMVGRYTDALKLREATLSGQLAVLGPNHPDVVASMNNLAISYENNGRLDEALTLREKVLALDEVMIGPEDPDTLRSMSNLANSYAAVGRFEEARRLQEKSLALRTKVLGANHPDTLLSMTNLSNTLASLGLGEEALTVQQDALALQRSHLGETHPNTLRSMNNLAARLAFLGRHDEALPLRERTLAIRSQLYGPDHPDTLAGMYSLALSYFDVGRIEDALELHQQTLALRKNALAARHPHILQSMREISVCLSRLGRSQEAIPVIDECIELAAGQAGDPTLIPALIDLRLRHFQQENDPVGCRETAALWERFDPHDDDSMYTAAVLRAVTADVYEGIADDANAAVYAREEADRAIEWLRKAIDAGYRNTAELTEDKDLEVLRDRDDFQTLISSLPTNDD